MSEGVWWVSEGEGGVSMFGKKRMRKGCVHFDNICQDTCWCDAPFRDTMC